MILDLSNLIGKSVCGNIKFESTGNPELLTIKNWVHNRPFKETIINILPTIAEDELPSQFTQIDFHLFTDKRIYIGMWVSYTKVTSVQVGHLIYIKNENKWIKQF
jgi:hypothetical protein